MCAECATKIENNQKKSIIIKNNYYQQHNKSKLNFAITPSSVCALCGVALHLKNSSEESKKFEREKKIYHNCDCNIMLKAFNMFLKIAPYKAALSAEKEKSNVMIFLYLKTFLTIFLPKKIK